MTEPDSAPDLESAVRSNQPDGESAGGGQRPPGANQRAGEPPAPATNDDPDPVDDTNPSTPALPQTGAHRGSAPSGEVAPT